MARIPDSEIEHIKAGTNLVALIQSRGVALKQQGFNWTGLCPFHDDKQTPNLIVTPGKGLFRCMAACCGKTGNAIQFVQWHDGVSFRHAFELLANGGKAAFEQSGGVAKKSTAPKLPCPLDAEGDSKALAQVSDYYAERLAKNPDALAYLASRSLDDESLIARFKIGFSDRTLGLRIPHARRKDGAELRENLKALGVYRENGREHLNGCLTVPIRNANGECCQIYGRRIDPKTPKENRHLYLDMWQPTAVSRPPCFCSEVEEASSGTVRGKGGLAPILSILTFQYTGRPHPVLSPQPRLIFPASFSQMSFPNG